MKRIAAMVVILAACKNAKKEPPKSEPPPALDPFTGTLTIERVVGARDLVHPGAAVADAMKTLEHQLGKATLSDGATSWWAAIDGDDCAYTYVAVKHDIIDVVMPPVKVGKDAPMMNRRECLKVLGKSLTPPEDPDAPGPPADGKVTAAQLRDQAPKAKSKWDGKTVEVAAVLGSVTTATSGSDKFVTVTLTDPSDAKLSIGCTLAVNTDPPADLKPGAAVIATATVKVDEWMSMGGGDPKLEANLSDCKLTLPGTAPPP